LLYGSDSHGHPYERVLIASQIIVCIILIALVVRIGRRAFNEVLKEEQKDHVESETETPPFPKAQSSSRLVQIRLDQ
jgi:hypothetical protein